MMHIHAHVYSLCMLHAYTSQLHVSMYICIHQYNQITLINLHNAHIVVHI